MDEALLILFVRFWKNEVMKRKEAVAFNSLCEIRDF